MHRNNNMGLSLTNAIAAVEESCMEESQHVALITPKFCMGGRALVAWSDGGRMGRPRCMGIQ